MDSTNTPLVVVTYGDLRDGSDALDLKIEQAFGGGRLGILAVSAVPRLQEGRQRLLLLAPQLANLPDEVKAMYEDPGSSYNFGWSQGKEAMKNGKVDSCKGSFYANPEVDCPTDDPVLREAYPTYCRPNVWPTDHLSMLEGAFKEVGGLMVQVGRLVLAACDRYLAGRCVPGQGKAGSRGSSSLVGSVGDSQCHKGRLLHYFPPPEPSSSSGNQNKVEEDSWCGWHRDHGALTGLLSAMYVRNGIEVPCPDTAACLYVRTRSGDVVKVALAPDCIAYQMGEAIELKSGGLLQATPHMVRAPSPNLAAGVSRNTLAVFMQPRWDAVLDPLYSASSENASAAANVPGWQPGMSFGDFTQLRIGQYYS